MNKDIKLSCKSTFQKKINEQKVNLFLLKNKNGLVMKITNYRGRVVFLWTPDSKEKFEDIV